MSNLIPGAASKCEPRRPIGPNNDTLLHMRFVVWAMQLDIDTVTVARIKTAMRVSATTAQRLRQLWLELTATRFYHDSMPSIVAQLDRR